MEATADALPHACLELVVAGIRVEDVPQVAAASRRLRAMVDEALPQVIVRECRSMQATPWKMLKDLITRGSTHSNAIATFVKAGCDVNVRDEKGAVLLHCASVSGNIPMVQGLLDAGADVDNATAGRGETPLFAACEGGHTVTAQTLIAAGASVDKARTLDASTPLLMASEMAYLAQTFVPICKCLVEAGASVNRVSPIDGRGPLYWAAYHGASELVAYLLACGGDVNQATTDDGATPLGIAKHLGHVETIALLLDAGAVQ